MGSSRLDQVWPRTNHLCVPVNQSLHATSPGRLRKCGPSPPEGIVHDDNLGPRVVTTVMHCASDVHTSQVVEAQVGGQPPVIAIIVDPSLSSASNEDSAVDVVYTSWRQWAYTNAKRTINAGFFPASSWCYYVFHCTLDERAAEASRRSEYLARWETALISIARSWKHTQSITTSVLLVSSLAILQLDTVLNNRDICTCMAASIVLALASILSSFIYSMSKDKFISRWKTSEAPDASFWRCIAMPLDFAICFHSHIPEDVIR
ncbi:hypothetical protein D9613_011287 [Agrocybe pediades]|uniref:Uncharacterized protein n=1 Tax=Agrocybe pediades TaxID=84607 RepID=A0A8H4QS86_9AGAR|nr:hypothetical protein D9613_011287 [Agrocybe pediades]